MVSLGHVYDLVIMVTYQPFYILHYTMVFLCPKPNLKIRHRTIDLLKLDRRLGETQSQRSTTSNVVISVNDSVP